MSALRLPRPIPCSRTQAALRLAPLLALAACGDATAPDQAALRLEIVAGDQQRGLPGQVLGEPLSVRVLDTDGEPVEGVRVVFEPAVGNGRVEEVRAATSATGRASARWVLGPRAGAQQRLTASVAGRGEVSFVASLVPPQETDLFLATGAGVADVRLVTYRADAFDAELAFTASLLDTLPIIPFADPGGHSEGAAFVRGRPPRLLASLRWTAARDTQRIAFAEPVGLPVTIWIVKGPFEQQAEVARAHAAAAREVWETSGMGVELSEVEIRDATGHPRAAEFHGLNSMLCSAGVPGAIGAVPGRLNVYYVGKVLTYAGYACGDHILMAEESGRWRTLLAHEIGHTMGLTHDRFGPENVMNPDPGSRLTEGQIFHAHFQWSSALNRIYRVHPRELWRECRSTMDGSLFGGRRPCMPAAFDIP